MKKKNNWLIIVLCILILLLVIYGIVKYFNGKNSTLIGTEQEVENIKFSNANIEKKNNKYIFYVTLSSDEDMVVESFDVEFKNKKGDTIETLSGFVGNLSKDQTKVVEMSSNKDLSKAYQVSYSIYKE